MKKFLLVALPVLAATAHVWSVHRPRQRDANQSGERRASRPLVPAVSAVLL